MCVMYELTNPQIHDLKKELSEVRSQTPTSGLAVREDQKHSGREEEKDVEDAEPEIKVVGVAGKLIEAAAVDKSSLDMKRSKRYISWTF